MKNKLSILALLSSLFLTACSKDNGVSNKNLPIEVSFNVSDFQGELRAANEPGSAAEQKINNLYFLLFDNAGAHPQRYYIDNSSAAGATWVVTEKKVILPMTQNEARDRQVYIVANVDPFIKGKLDGVNSVSALQSVFVSNQKPWSDQLKSPFLMSGHKNHDFRTNYQLKTIPLVRSVAKIELNIKLSEKYRVKREGSGANLDNFRYRYVSFDKRTYILKPSSKADDLINSVDDVWPSVANWSTWGASLNTVPTPDAGFGYKLDNQGKVQTLKAITYLNERDHKGTAIQIALYPLDEGLLPPPEFGPEFHAIPLPDKIERNHWYSYNIEI
jgi:hypothetical protein